MISDTVWLGIIGLGMVALQGYIAHKARQQAATLVAVEKTIDGHLSKLEDALVITTNKKDEVQELRVQDAKESSVNPPPA